MAIATAIKAPVTRAQKDAARATKKAAAVVATRDANVGTLINKAGQAAASMYTLCREAAQAAAKQLNPAKPLQERLSEVVSLYAADFAAAGHNVKAVFSDALMLHACAQTPVSVNAIGTDGKKCEQHVTAADAVNMSKHAMRDAAKQVREAHGIGRKAGAGRKAAVPAAKPTSKVAQPATVTASEVDRFTSWLDDMDAYIGDAVYHPRIVAHLITLGFTLSKAAKGRTVTGAASH